MCYTGKNNHKNNHKNISLRISEIEIVCVNVFGPLPDNQLEQVGTGLMALFCSVVKIHFGKGKYTNSYEDIYAYM